MPTSSKQSSTSSDSRRSRKSDAPPASSADVRRRMQATRQRDTPAEVALRSVLHGLGLRFRVQRSPIAGLRRRADIVFAPARVAVFVDGCFWHGCPEHATWPKTNARWWREKIEGNRSRDADTDARLAAAGWLSVRVWTHEESAEAAERIACVVRSRRQNGIRTRSKVSVG